MLTLKKQLFIFLTFLTLFYDSLTSQFYGNLQLLSWSPKLITNKPPDSISFFRSISLLPFFVRILEKLLLKRLLSCIAENHIIPNSQFGFRTAHSTIQQVHNVVDTLKRKNFSVQMHFLTFLRRSIGYGMTVSSSN